MPGRDPTTLLDGREPDPWLRQLTGVGSSKRTFYPEYRRKSEGLERALKALEAVSAALCATTQGPFVLAQAVVEAAAGHFDAVWAVMVLADDAFPAASASSGEALPRLLARAPDGSLATTRAALPPETWPLVDSVLEQQRPVLAASGPQPGSLGAPMFRGEGLAGVLLVHLRPGRSVDDSDTSILQVLANQAAVALQNAFLFQESERLRARVTALYEEAQHRAGELEARNSQLHRAQRRLVEARQHQLITRERNRIARDLHDSVAQYLVSIGMTLDWCRQQLPEASPVHARTVAAKELARGAIARIRVAIFELSALEGGEVGLVEALHDLARDFRKTARLAVGVHVRGTPYHLPPVTEYALFQIAQEAVFNVYKHAQASSARVDLCYRPKQVWLAIADDGSGDAAALRTRLAQARRPARSGHHRGLVNVAHRARELGGTVAVAGRQGGGVVIRVTIPVARVGD
jgi:signal transduction histidine kinase